MITQLRSYGPMRLTLVAIVVVALAAWSGVALFVHTGYPDGPTVAGTPQQVAAAQAALATLPGVTGATVDPYDTACRQPRSYCLSSTTLTRTQLASEALALFKSRGATVSTHACTTQAVQGVQCTATLHWYGARLRLSSDAVISLQPRAGDPVTLAVTVDDYPAVGGRPGTALGAWSVASPFPASWQLDPPCTSTGPGGCLAYFLDSPATTTLVGNVDTLTAAAVQAARAHGYSTTTLCRPAQDHLPANCDVSMLKYRGPGGKDGIQGNAVVRRLTPTTVGISISLDALIG